MTEWKMVLNGPQVMLPIAHRGVSIGEVEVVFTQAGHAHVGAYSDGKRAGSIAYRGGHWYASAHVYAEHGWGERPFGRGGYRHQFTEHGTNRPIAPSYRAHVVAAITAAVSAFVAEHPEVLSAAERNHLGHDLVRARKEEAEALAALDAARARVSEIEDALARVPATAREDQRTECGGRGDIVWRW